MSDIKADLVTALGKLNEAGRWAGDGSMPTDDELDWAEYHARLQTLAETAGDQGAT